MKVEELLKDKGFEVIAVDGDTTVSEGIEKMIDRNIGALLVVVDGKMSGIFTERDVLRCWATKGTCGGIPIREIMSKNLVVVELSADVSDAMSMMIQKKVRHLPVVEGEKIVSVLSMRDVVAAKVSDLQSEITFLKDYITDKY